jgi:hypothetical protein
MFEEYSTCSPDQAIGKASDLYIAHDRWWFLPFVFELHGDEVTYAAVWEERCVTRLLPDVSSPNRNSLLADLTALREMRLRNATAEEFGHSAREIWYRGSERDFAQTAISKLFELVGHESHPDGRRPMVLYGAAIGNLVTGSNYPFSMLEMSVTEFAIVCQQRRDKLLPGNIIGLSANDEYSLLHKKNACG